MLAESSPKKKVDDESSVYSVDQEGFYTSFHNDSGLKRSTNTLIDEDSCDISPSKDTASVCSIESVIHKPSIKLKDKFAGLRRGNPNLPKVLNKVTPPLPPDRGSSNPTETDTGDIQTPQKLLSFTSQDSSTSTESDAELVFARVHNKTNISCTGFPSLVALSTSDDESSPENNRKTGVPQCGVNQTGSDLGLSTITCASQFSNFSLNNGSYLDNSNSSSPSLKHSKSVLECTNQGYDALLKNTEAAKTEPGYQSWPRTNKHHTGILKSTEKQFDQAPSRPPKTLNFDPVVNLFKDGYQGSVQVPLPSPTNSSASESSFVPVGQSRVSSFQTPAAVNQSYNLAVPISEDSKSGSRSKQGDLPLKYQPVITVTPRSRSRSGDRKKSSQHKQHSASPSQQRSSSGQDNYHSNNKPHSQSTPAVPNSQRAHSRTSPSLYAVSPVMAPRDTSRQNSSASTGSNGSNYMDMQSLKSADSIDSLASSDCLNFNDSNHYMTMSSPSISPNLSNMDFSISSTPSGSMDSLLDLRKTPTNELETDTYQINTNLHRNSDQQRYNRNSNSASDRNRQSPLTNGHMNGSTTNQGNQSYSNSRSQHASISNVKPGRRSLDSTATSDRDLTNVTHMTFDSSNNMTMTPVSQGSNVRNGGPGSSHTLPMSRDMKSAENTPRQAARRSRLEQRKEPSYRNINATNRHSLPSDMSGITAHIRHVPLNDLPKGSKSSNSVGQPTSTSGKSPLGFNSVLVSNSDYNAQNGRKLHSPRNQSGPMKALPSNVINDQISSRSDSYRVAMGNPSRTSSYRNAMHASKSYPNLPPTKQSGPYRVAMDMSPNKAFANNYVDDDDDVLSRADSYRIAVRNTNGIVPDMGRNGALKFADSGAIPENVNSKLKALSMDDKNLMSGRDVRRMGITDVDQVKNVKAKPVIKESKSMPQMQMHQVKMRDNRSQSSSQVQTRRPESKPNPPPSTEKAQDGRIRKVTTHDVDPIEVVQTVDISQDSRKSAKNNPNRSSTYIQFDPIFEDNEDFYGGIDMSSVDYSKHLSDTSKSKLGLINGTMKDANANMVKRPVSKAGKMSGAEDDWRFSQV